MIRISLIALLCCLLSGCRTMRQQTQLTKRLEQHQQSVQITDTVEKHSVETDSVVTASLNESLTQAQRVETSENIEQIVEQIIEKSDSNGNRVVETQRTVKRNYTQQSYQDYLLKIQNQAMELSVLRKQMDSAMTSTVLQNIQYAAQHDSINQLTDKSAISPVSWFGRVKIRVVSFCSGMIVVVMLLMLRRKLRKHLK